MLPAGRIARIAALALTILPAGCGPSAPAGSIPAAGRHAVRGKLVADGDVSRFDGVRVRFEAANNPILVAVGVVHGGEFEAATVDGMKAEPGLPPGNYRVKLEAPRGDDGKPQAGLLPAQYLEYKTAGLSVTVPPPGELVIEVKSRRR